LNNFIFKYSLHFFYICSHILCGNLSCLIFMWSVFIQLANCRISVQGGWHASTGEMKL